MDRDEAVVTPDTEGFGRRVIRGGFWASGSRVVERVLVLARTIILARMLAPEDFGLFGIALLAISALNMFTATGFTQALIQKREDPEPFLDIAWTVQVLRGCVLGLLLVLAAPYVASFFDEPAATPLLRALAVTQLLRGFGNIGIVYFQKELDFRRQTIYQVTGTVAELVVAVIAAFLLGNAWALAFGMIAGDAVRLAMSYALHPFRPRLCWDPEKARDLFGFGRWVVGSSILFFLLNNADTAFVGKILGVTALGLYQMAFRLALLPASEITNITSQVSFPAYSRLQQAGAALRSGYLRVLQVVAFISFPLAGGIYILGPEFTRVFLGPDWMPMVPTMRVLALWGLLMSLFATTTPLFQAIGRPDIATKLQLAKLVLLLLLIFPFTVRWGILGTAEAQLVNAVIVTPCAGYFAFRMIRCSLKAAVMPLAVPAFATATMLGGLAWLQTLTAGTAGLIHLITLAAAGAAIYLGVIAVLDSLLGYGARAILKQLAGAF